MGAVALIWDLIARDGASAQFTKVGTSAERAGVQAESSEKKISGLSKLMGVGFVTAVAGASMIKMAGDFQQSTNVLVTAAGETQSNLELVRKGILNIATTTGTSWQQVTDGMYVLEKAGYRGADALKVEMAAAQGAREEGASLGTVTNALTSIMASYHLKAGDAVMVTNELKTAAGESKTTMESFAGSLSTVLPLASANKISFADVAGSLASLTQHGTSADEATQELAFSIRGLSAPNAVAQKEMSQLGISSQDVAMRLGDGPGGRGLAGTLKYLSDTVKSKIGPSGLLILSTLNASKAAAQDATIMFNKLAPATQKLAEEFIKGTISSGDWNKAVKELSPQQAALARQFATTENNARGFQQQLRTGVSVQQTASDALKKMAGGANGLNVILQTTGESMAGTDERIKRIADSAKIAGTNVSGWDSTQKLFNVRLDMLKQTAEAAGITLGTKLMPGLSELAGWAAKNTGAVEGIVAGMVALKVGMLAVSAAEAAWAASTAFASIITQIDSFETLAIAAMYGVEAAMGPVGIAIGAIGLAVGIATHGFGLFGQGASDQVKPVQALTDAITQDGDAVGKLTAAQVNNTLQSKGAYDAASKLGISQSMLLRATLGNVDAQQAVASAVAKARGEFAKGASTNETYGRGLNSSTKATKDAKAAADLLAGTTAVLNGQLNASKHAADNEAAALAGVPGSSDKAKGALQALTGVIKGIPDHVGVNIDVNSAAAIAALQGFVNEASAAQAAAQAVGSVTYSVPNARQVKNQTHASGGYLGQGWNLVGEQGPEYINNSNGRVMSASDTRRAGNSGGGDIHVHVGVMYGNADQAAREVLSALQRLKGRGVRTNLG